jgi:serine/threonine-protein kinase
MARSPEAGEHLGRYHLLEELGRGGMAVVFRAEDTTLGREVAIKIMHPHLWGEEEYAKRFMREARAVAALHHPNIVEIYDYGEAQDEELPGYIISEYVEGPNLREFIDGNGCPFPEVAAMIVRTLAKALKCAHERGIIHRDLKPENVMIAVGGRVVLTDFGIARIVEGEAVTQTGAMLGSPAYMSPEQARGQHTDRRSDLFSLGVVLYLLCTGQLPFSAKDPISTILRIVEGHYEPAIKRNPRTGRWLDRVIQRLLKRDPDERFADADAVIEALDQVLAESGITPAEADAELARYFEEPGSFNRTLMTQVLDRSMTLAREASESGDYPRALAFCDRVLSFEPDHSGALELMSRLSQSRRGLGVLWAGLGMLLLGIAVGGLFWHFKGDGDEPRRRKRDAGAPSPVPPPAPDSRVVDQRLPDGPPADLDRPDSRRRRRPRPRPAPVATRVPDAGVVRIAPDARRPRPRDARPAATHAEILVAIGTWCDVYLDGKHVGRSPMRDRPLRVKPGPHEIFCEQGKGGPFKRVKFTLRAGQRKEITGLVLPTIEVRLQLRHGDAVRVDGRTYSGNVVKLTPTRHRVDVLRGGKPVPGRGGWVSFPARACTLSDEPVLRCE